MMQRGEIRDRVKSLVHGIGGDGKWLVPYFHDEHCVFCDRLTSFIERLLNEHES